MFALPRFPSETSAAGRVGLRPALAWAVLLLLACASLSALPAGAAAQNSLGERIHERFTVQAEDDTLHLRPIEGDPAIRSIELEDGEEEALVNGKAFSAEELRAFLGKDGELIAELAELDAAGRRAALGLGSGESGNPGEAMGGHGAGVHGAPGVPRIPPIPPVPGLGHLRVESDGDDRVSFGRSIEIGAGETTGDAVCIGCSVTVAGEVEGDAVAVGGSVHVQGTGKVQGNAVGVGGSVRLESGATVEGDAVAIGGSVQAEEGATVEGQRSTVGWGEGWRGHGKNGRFFDLPFWFGSDAGELVWSLLRALFLALLCCISVLLARGPMERTSRRLIEEPWKAVFAGLLTQLLFFPVLILVTVILAVSVVGIPLLVLVPVAVLALLLATLLGFASVAQSLGRWAAERFGWRLAEPFLPVVVGVAMIQAVTIVARFVGLPGGFFGLLAFALVCLGFFFKYVAWTMGLGAMTLTLLGRDWRRPDLGSDAPSRRSGAREPAAGDDLPVQSAPPPPPPAPETPETPEAPTATTPGPDGDAMATPEATSEEDSLPEGEKNRD